MRAVARFLKVLADETRLRMLWLLSNRRELCVCDLMQALGITQSKASRHLATLRHAGLVVDRREGTWTHYSIVSPQDEMERALLDTLCAKLVDHPDSGQLLQDLQRWIESANRDATCMTRQGR
ncbi:MAG: metalloregulator ArsR/SmtB family transcription factor [Bradymonadales bacterium]|nr:metalloregulator ArsR/SmtB family transcription factor [Bradymonadales bacterium]